MRLALETEQDHALVEAMIDRAFGPARLVKAAERLREGRAPHLAVNVVAFDGETMVGCVRQWPIRVGTTPALLLGPIVVEASQRDAGVGALLMERAIAAAEEAGWTRILLVGDEPYFGRWGFTRVAVTLPGPVDPRRVLARLPPAETLCGTAAPED